ncbi:MAG TPA: MaoC family dehydratase [Methylomirabilota bacterium]|nr:MaoC family dehydratase [Methylomirabilota bacterium]
MKYWEDIKVADTAILGSHTVTEDEILAFARKYDPQPFHLDREAATRSIFGGLIASGWHSCAIMMRLSVDHMKKEQLAGVGSPGIDSCRFVKPVRPGDTVTVRTEITESWPSRSKPIGFIRRRADMLNQHGDVVLTVIGVGMFLRKGEPQPQARRADT